MGFMKSVTAQLRPVPEVFDSEEVHEMPQTGHAQNTEDKNDGDVDVEAIQKPVFNPQSNVESGVARVEAVQAVWGKRGRYMIIAGLAVMMIMYELDNSTVYIYQNYATSAFNEISLLGTLGTAGVIVFAVIKPPIAKLSNIIGRGETYVLTISCYILSYILCASSKSINSYAAGYIIYNIGQSGTNIMNDIIISDITTARWRGLGIGVSFFPFLLMPWIAAFITESVVDGIGWRWGIGMFAILMPIAGSLIIGTLLYYQRMAKKAGIVTKQKMTVYEFCSQIDLGGSILFCGGFAMLLLPLTLASTTTSRWRTPYLDALMAIGGMFLLALPWYEKFLAKHPLVPIHYFKNLAIVTSILLIATDSMGFAVTHTYLYAWSTVAHNFSVKIATFYIYVNGVMQCFTGIIAGWIMLKTRRYKWLVMAGVTIRIIGYGIMLRLRGAENSIGELVVVQLIQGIGSGIIQTSVFVGAQIQVPHSQLAQMTALIICFSFLGSSIGACIAGGVYTGTFKDQLRDQLGGTAANGALVDQLFNSITGVLPAWGTSERTAIDNAYTNVMRFFTYAAIGASVPSFFMAWFMPNNELPDQNNLVEE
ncbi:MFS general substrate transporter [Mollisia scopiformis]|uniref:MFS general substrate transporter n=1 Tax=Mollisia scopiformis TaxID=149040 RepID=A0A194WXH0_MOLSC|nr:MFS general substrate transporter [Mollisia scopiformis]KUJ12625.1 MFS general substrate transporter [Mollisia scopiformis]